MHRKIAAAALALGVGLGLSGATQAQGIREINCSAVDGGSGRVVNLGRYSVVRETAEDGPFTFSASGDFDIIGLTCRRTSPVPQPNDYKVAMAGLALYVTTRRGGQRVRTVLYIEDDQFVLRILEGRLNAYERETAAQRIQDFYTAVNGTGADAEG